MHEPWGGVHCLDFANTLEPRGGPPPLDLPPGYGVRDELSSYDELAGWAVHKGTVERAAAVRLLAAADADPRGAEAVLSRAQRLRDAVYRAFWRIAHDEPPASDDLETIMREYAAASAHASLVPTADGIVWDWPADSASLDRPVWPVARSAVDLLTNGEHDRIKVCPGPGRAPLACAWLFYDATKNRSRRWCSMTDCGAVTKVRLQTQRRRIKRATSAP
jgi:predicted RNA-binding Zn ribbon-like protein